MPMNMAYCRFENTLAALRECLEALSDSDGSSPFDGLSDAEKKAAQRLVNMCINIADDYGDAL